MLDPRRRLRRILTRAPVISAASRRNVGRRSTPVSSEWGFDRGLPVDRYYIARFLERFAAADGYTGGVICGRILEIGGRTYADAYRPTSGEPAARTRVDVLHENDANPDATIVGDLADPRTLPADTFDCIICTQVLPVIWDVPAALRALHAALRPGGTLLATVPGITRALTPDRDNWGDWWRFTSLSARRLAEEAFPGGDVHVEAYGNLLSATLFLHGFAAHELSAAELDLRDPDYEVIVAVRARKAA